jgi:hypothetical protein
VTLTPRGKLTASKPEELIINGSLLTDTLGREVDGNDDGQPGGDFYRDRDRKSSVSWRRAIGPRRPPAIQGGGRPRPAAHPRRAGRSKKLRSRREQEEHRFRPEGVSVYAWTLSEPLGWGVPKRAHRYRQTPTHTAHKLDADRTCAVCAVWTKTLPVGRAKATTHRAQWTIGERSKTGRQTLRNPTRRPSENFTNAPITTA